MKRELLPYLYLQCARFGALTASQAQALLEGHSSLTHTYQLLKEGVNEGWLEYYIFTNNRHQICWRPSARLRERLVREFGMARLRRLREGDCVHSVMFLITVAALARHERVLGVTSEHELTPAAAAAFLPGRTPDAVVAVNGDSGPIEIALEVEATRKSRTRIKNILHRYAEVLSDPSARCQGLLVVATLAGGYDMYERELRKISPEVRAKIHLCSIEGLASLPVEYFGAQGASPLRALENAGTVYSGGIRYESINSLSWGPAPTAKRPRGTHPVTDGQNLQVIDQISRSKEWSWRR